MLMRFRYEGVADHHNSQTNQNIATFLESDIDLCHYRQVCCSTRDAVNGDGNSFWRRRFTSVFETPSWSSSGKRLEINERFRLEYSKRKGHLKNGAIFQRGTSKVEKACLEMLRDMIIGRLPSQRTSL